MTDHHAFTISGGPFGPIPSTHVFPRSAALGDLLAQLLDTTAMPADAYALSNVNVEPGEFYRGNKEIVLPIDLPLKQRNGLRKADAWNGVRKGLRSLRGRSRLDDYHEHNPTRKGERNRERSSENYLANELVGVDFEGQDYLGNVIVRPNGANTPYDDYRLFMGGAASIDKTKPPARSEGRT